MRLKGWVKDWSWGSWSSCKKSEYHEVAIPPYEKNKPWEMPCRERERPRSTEVPDSEEIPWEVGAPALAAPGDTTGNRDKLPGRSFYIPNLQIVHKI